MTDADGLLPRIEAAWPALGPQEQRVAAFLRARPDESALYNSSELARLAGVSKATVSRLYRRLGFGDSAEARESLRARRREGVPFVLDPAGDPFAERIAQDAENLRRLAAETAPEAVRAAGAALARARRVLVVGTRSGLPPALQLRQALAQARPDVVLVPERGQSAGEDLVGLDAADVAVVVALRRRAAGTGRLLATLVASPAQVVRIAERGAPAAPGVDHDFAVPIDAPGAFDSHVAATALVGALAESALRALGDAAAARAGAIDAAYASLGELDPA